MKLPGQIVKVFRCWIASIATAINTIFARMRSQRDVQLIEGEPDTFTLHLRSNINSQNLPDHRVRMTDGSVIDALPPNWVAILNGSRIELALQSSRFLFRPLELPKRAAEYLDGIVRSQIDRLTPWTANEAIYSWTPPADRQNDRIHLMIAATTRAMVTPYLHAMATFNPSSIVVTTTQSEPNAEAAPIRFIQQCVRNEIDVARIRQILVAVLLLSALSTAISFGISAVTASNLSGEQHELLQKISARKAAMRTLFGGSALRTLEQRKRTTPSNVIVLDALSALLPDDTYVTELRVEREKVQIVGVTSDAASLIRLIEKSTHFAHATFFAPTTRLRGDTREQFHIEARINPVFTVGS